MAGDRKRRIGLIGYGQIGTSLCENIQTHHDLGMEVAFICEKNPETASKVPSGLLIESMDDFARFKPDLVVEAAHPDAVRQFAEIVLRQKDLMIMSVSALVDTRLETAIRRVCQDHGTSLYIPHGAVLGLDGLKDGLSVWEQITITMKKNPQNLNFSAVPEIRSEEITEETVLYDGPTRGILPLYPKNVNSHATLALALLGMDRTHSVLVADPGLEESIIEIDASGGGNSIHIERRNPIKGVTGKLTILSVVESLKTIFGGEETIKIC